MVAITLPTFMPEKEKKGETLGILAFETGKTMCRLVSLYNSLSDKEIARLRRDTIKSKGVAYLISNHECFLLNLTAVELISDLDIIASTVSRLSRKCSDITLSQFELVYNDLKLGFIDLRKLDYCSKSTKKIINRMEKLVTATCNLHAVMESIAVLEDSEKKMHRWRTNTNTKNNNLPKPNLDYFIEKLAFQRKQVEQYNESSLWNQTVDKIVGIMAKIICIVYARICSVFGSFFSQPQTNSFYCLIEHRLLYQKNLFQSDDQYQGLVQKGSKFSGPIFKDTKLSDVGFYRGPIKSGIAAKYHSHYHGGYEVKRISDDRNSTILKFAPSWTVGGVGLAMRYAKVVLLAERCLHAVVSEKERGELYEMLPERVRAKVRAKLKGRWRKEERKGEEAELAMGWSREAVEEMMEWLSPMAHDTVRWHEERMMEKKRFEVKERTLLLLQTLHYSDLEKAEAAIVEVLVGLTCIYHYENSQ